MPNVNDYGAWRGEILDLNVKSGKRYIQCTVRIVH